MSSNQSVGCSNDLERLETTSSSGSNGLAITTSDQQAGAAATRAAAVEPAAATSSSTLVDELLIALARAKGIKNSEELQAYFSGIGGGPANSVVNVQQPTTSDTTVSTMEVQQPPSLHEISSTASTTSSVQQASINTLPPVGAELSSCSATGGASGVSFGSSPNGATTARRISAATRSTVTTTGAIAIQTPTNTGSSSGSGSGTLVNDLAGLFNRRGRDLIDAGLSSEKSSSAAIPTPKAVLKQAAEVQQASVNASSTSLQVAEPTDLRRLSGPVSPEEEELLREKRRERAAKHAGPIKSLSAGSLTQSDEEDVAARVRQMKQVEQEQQFYYEHPAENQESSVTVTSNSPSPTGSASQRRVSSQRRSSSARRGSSTGLPNRRESRQGSVSNSGSHGGGKRASVVVPPAGAARRPSMAKQAIEMASGPLTNSVVNRRVSPVGNRSIVPPITHHGHRRRSSSAAHGLQYSGFDNRSSDFSSEDGGQTKRSNSTNSIADSESTAVFQDSASVGAPAEGDVVFISASKVTPMNSDSVIPFVKTGSSPQLSQDGTAASSHSKRKVQKSNAEHLSSGADFAVVKSVSAEKFYDSVSGSSSASTGTTSSSESDLATRTAKDYERMRKTKSAVDLGGFKAFAHGVSPMSGEASPGSQSGGVPSPSPRTKFTRALTLHQLRTEKRRLSQVLGLPPRSNSLGSSPYKTPKNAIVTTPSAESSGKKNHHRPSRHRFDKSTSSDEVNGDHVIDVAEEQQPNSSMVKVDSSLGRLDAAPAVKVSLPVNDSSGETVGKKPARRSVGFAAVEEEQAPKEEKKKKASIKFAGDDDEDTTTTEAFQIGGGRKNRKKISFAGSDEGATDMKEDEPSQQARTPTFAEDTNGDPNKEGKSRQISINVTPSSPEKLGGVRRTRPRASFNLPDEDDHHQHDMKSSLDDGDLLPSPSAGGDPDSPSDFDLGDKKNTMGARLQSALKKRDTTSGLNSSSQHNSSFRQIRSFRNSTTSTATSHVLERKDSVMNEDIEFMAQAGLLKDGIDAVIPEAGPTSKRPSWASNIGLSFTSAGVVSSRNISSTTEEPLSPLGDLVGHNDEGLAWYDLEETFIEFNSRAEELKHFSQETFSTTEQRGNDKFQRITILLSKWYANLSLIFIVFNLFAISARIGLGTQNMPAMFVYLELALDIVLFAGNILNFFVPFESKGHMVLDRRLIAKRYMKDPMGASFDFISTFPMLIFFILAGHKGHEFARVNVGLRVLKFSHFFELFQAQMPASIHPSVWRLVHYSTNIIIIATIMCTFNLLVIRSSSVEESRSWLALPEAFSATSTDEAVHAGLLELEGSEGATVYMWVWLQAISAIADKKFPYPQTDRQFYFALPAVMLGAAVLVVLLSSVEEIVVDIVERSSVKQHKIGDVLAVMEKQDLPPDLIDEIITYYSRMWDICKSFDFNADSDLLSDLPDELRLDIEYECNARVIRSIPLFKTVADNQNFVRLLAGELHHCVILPGAPIVMKGEEGDCMFFLSAGDAAVLGGEYGDEILYYLGAGSFFGETTMLFGGERPNTIVAVTLCVCYVVTDTQFEAIVDEFPEALEEILETAVKALDERETSGGESSVGPDGELLRREGSGGDFDSAVENPLLGRQSSGATLLAATHFGSGTTFKRENSTGSLAKKTSANSMGNGSFSPGSPTSGHMSPSSPSTRKPSAQVEEQAKNDLRQRFRRKSVVPVGFSLGGGADGVDDDDTTQEDAKEELRSRFRRKSVAPVGFGAGLSPAMAGFGDGSVSASTPSSSASITPSGSVSSQRKKSRFFGVGVSVVESEGTDSHTPSDLSVGLPQEAFSFGSENQRSNSMQSGPSGAPGGSGRRKSRFFGLGTGFGNASGSGSRPHPPSRPSMDEHSNRKTSVGFRFGGDDTATEARKTSMQSGSHNNPEQHQRQATFADIPDHTSHATDHFAPVSPVSPTRNVGFTFGTQDNDGSRRFSGQSAGFSAGGNSVRQVSSDNRTLSSDDLGGKSGRELTLGDSLQSGHAPGSVGGMVTFGNQHANQEGVDSETTSQTSFASGQSNSLTPGHQPHSSISPGKKSERRELLKEKIRQGGKGTKADRGFDDDSLEESLRTGATFITKTAPSGTTTSLSPSTTPLAFKATTSPSSSSSKKSHSTSPSNKGLLQSHGITLPRPRVDHTTFNDDVDDASSESSMEASSRMKRLLAVGGAVDELDFSSRSVGSRTSGRSGRSGRGGGPRTREVSKRSQNSSGSLGSSTRPQKVGNAHGPNPNGSSPPDFSSNAMKDVVMLLDGSEGSTSSDENDNTSTPMESDSSPHADAHLRSGTQAPEDAGNLSVTSMPSTPELQSVVQQHSPAGRRDPPPLPTFNNSANKNHPKQEQKATTLDTTPVSNSALSPLGNSQTTPFEQSQPKPEGASGRRDKTEALFSIAGPESKGGSSTRSGGGTGSGSNKQQSVADMEYSQQLNSDSNIGLAVANSSRSVVQTSGSSPGSSAHKHGSPATSTVITAGNNQHLGQLLSVGPTFIESDGDSSDDDEEARRKGAPPIPKGSFRRHYSAFDDSMRRSPSPQ